MQLLGGSCGFPSRMLTELLIGGQCRERLRQLNAAAITERSASIESLNSDKYRAYSVVADGAIVGRLAPGETCTLSLPVGEHQIAAKIDWAGSNTIHVNVSSERTEFLRVRSNLRGIRVALGLWYVLFSPGSYLCVEYRENSRCT